MKKLFVALIISATVLLGGVRVGQGQEEIPVFAASMVYPNVMFIFDTSGSMDWALYKNRYGQDYRNIDWQWQQQICLDADSNPLYSGSGFQLCTNAERTLDPNPDAKLSGGNHPESKLFQAKQALRQVLAEIDTVNLGFATYLQEREPLVNALYYKTTTTYHGTHTYYQFAWYKTTGSWSKGPGEGGYIDPTTLQVKPSTSNSDGYSLLEAPLTNVLVGTSGTTASAYPTQYDFSTFGYPGTSYSSKPHGWSYQHATWTNQFLSNRTWPVSNRRNPYFPADQGTDNYYLGDPNELDNYDGDDHIFFVHLPDPDDGDDTAMANRDKIMSFLSLERATDPVYDCRVTPSNVWCPGTQPYRQYTMMPYTNSIPCGGNTPLGASLANARDYYLSYFAQDNQTQIGCRENFVILLTDGVETCGGNPESSAGSLFNLTWDGEARPVKTYVIGFGLDATSAASLNDIAAAGGTDEAFFATNLQELITTLTNIFESITAGSYARSDPVISSEGDNIYAAYFDYPGWTGHVKKYLIDENGNVIGEDSSWYDDSRTPPDDVLEGDAGARLNDQPDASRTIWTSTTDWDGSNTPTRFEFDDAGAGTLHPLLNPGDFNEDMSTDQTDSQELIRYIRDVGYNGGAYAWSTREANWKLGDIYRSTPVVVTEPRFELGYLDYGGFSADRSGRDTLVLVGANDGMLHAFNEADGEEQWAYIPKKALHRLKNLKTGHTYFVDLSVKAADIWSPGGGGTVFPAAGQDKDGWHTVVISGLRQGGNYYFALDITDSTAAYPKPLWELTDTSGSNNMGETWSMPTFGRVKVSGVDKYVAFVGGGYSEISDVGNSFYIIDIEAGSFLKEFSDSEGNQVGLDSETVPSAVRALDLDRNGYIERVYFANSSGKLYKLDLSSENTGDWQIVEIFDPGTFDYTALPTTVVPVGATLPANTSIMNQPVYFPPAVIKDRYGDQHYYILYGTGNELDPQNQVSQDFFFEIEDLEDGTAQCNWVYVFDTGEKCLSRPVAFNYVVYFSTYNPIQVCGAGQGYIYGLTISRGATIGGEGALQYNLAGEEMEPAAEHTETGGILGIPSSPVVTNGMIYFNSSNNTNVRQLQISVVGGQLRSWQEVF